MAKMAVVGCEASGKTVFMAALTDYYRTDPRKPGKACLVPENSAANRFAALLRRQMRFMHQWPPATNPGRTVELEWSMMTEGRKVAEIGMLEFGGETFRAAFRGEDDGDRRKQAVTELLKYLSSAEFIVILVSITELLRDPGELSPEEFERDTEAMWVTRGLLDFAKKELPHAGLVIGLTRADRYRNELEAAGGANAFFTTHWPSIRAVAPDVPVVEVASVDRINEDGRPGDDYRTDGVLPVMRELAKHLHGDAATLRAELAAEREALDKLDASASPTTFSTRVKKFEKRINHLLSSAAIADNAEDADSGFSADANRLRDKARAGRSTAGKNRAKSKKKKHSPPEFSALRWVIPSLLLTTAIAAAAWFFNRERNTIDHESRPPAPMAPVATNQVKAAAIVTNEAEKVETPTTNEVKKVEVPITNEVKVAVITTNEVKMVVTETATTNQVNNSATNSVNDHIPIDLKRKRMLATRYYVGTKKVAKDLVKARALYEEAANEGDAVSANYLAVMYEAGEGGARDMTTALKWYNRAAAGGVGDAMFRLGMECWEERRSDIRAKKKARAWFEKAKAAGCKLDELEGWLVRSRDW